MSSVAILSRLPLVVASVLFVLLTSLGNWGSIGPADGAFYQAASECARSSSAGGFRKRCFHSGAKAALLPVLTVGSLARISAGPDSVRVALRVMSVAFGLLALWLIWGFAQASEQRLSGTVSLILVLSCTPLIERARAGAVEVWLLAMLLLLARLILRERHTFRRTLTLSILSAALFATHSYAGSALLCCLLVPMTLGRLGKTREEPLRFWFGWLGAHHWAGAVGGLSLFALFWPGFQEGAQIWERLVGPFKSFHAPFRGLGEVWVQGYEAGAPPFYMTLWVLLLALPFFVTGLTLLGLLHRRCRADDSLNPLILLAGAWFLVNSLQGSPFADGYDHRLVILGLLVPVAARGFVVFEFLISRWSPTRLQPSSLALAILFFSISFNLVVVLQGGIPSSGLSASAASRVASGSGAFARPVLEPLLLERMASIPKGTKLACSPWESVCRRSLIPGFNALGLGEGRLRGSRFFDADLVLVPNDPAYITPPSLMGDLSRNGFSMEEVVSRGWLRYGISWVRPSLRGAPSSAPHR